jgi:8-hydroxy-5-deazaflavin:NADPH oxidoreductase
MKVGIIGSGVVGRTLAEGFLTRARGDAGDPRPEAHRSQAWLAGTPGANGGTFSEAAGFGDIVVLAVKGLIAERAIELAGADNLAGKPLIDATNPLADEPPVEGVLKFTTGPNESLGERIQSLVPGAQVVKAFNSVGAACMVNPHYDQGPPTMFICGNSSEAKRKVAEVLRQLGWEAYDCGGIIAARAIEPLCMLWCIPWFLRNQWTHAFKLLMR